MRFLKNQYEKFFVNFSYVQILKKNNSYKWATEERTFKA